MSDPQGPKSASAPSAPGAHAPPDSHDAPVDEEVLRSPAWLPFVGLALLLLGSVGTYLWVYPGVANTHATVAADAGAAGAGSADGGTAGGGATPAAQPGPAH